MCRSRRASALLAQAEARRLLWLQQQQHRLHRQQQQQRRPGLSCQRLGRLPRSCSSSSSRLQLRSRLQRPLQRQCHHLLLQRQQQQRRQQQQQLVAWLLHLVAMMTSTLMMMAWVGTVHWQVVLLLVAST
jgi:hypothetical protein